jgi:hypothetical protein
MGRLPFASEGVMSEVADNIRPVDRQAGRGLDGNTRAPQRAQSAMGACRKDSTISLANGNLAMVVCCV